jgi:hypothetical protein
MLTHIVCWKYRAETSDAARAEHIAALRALPAVIEEIVSFTVGKDILHLDRSYDTGLVAVFDDVLALESYTVHPQHQAVAAMGKSIAEHVVSVDLLDG